jgi:thiol-disulfide isomerase/thioredoxin
MNAAVLTVRLGLAAMFAVAGIAKLRDRAGTRTAVFEFGVPERLTPGVAWLLPSAELAAAALLLFAPAAAAGAALGLALLATFTAAIGIALARGRAPDCHCFGQLHSSPAGAKTLVRNVCLMALAAFALVGSLAGQTTSVVAWIGRLNDSQRLALVVAVAAGVVIGVGAVAFLSLLRSYGKLLVRFDRLEAAVAAAGIDLPDDVEIPVFGLEPGTDVAAYSAPSLSGTEVSLGELASAGRPLLLLFTSSRCGPCRALLPTAAGWQRDHDESLTVAFAMEGAPASVRTEAGELELENVLVDANSRLYELFEANGTPSAVLIGANGRVASRIAAGSEEIAALVARTVAPEPSYGLGIGQQAPDLPLEVLDGDASTLGSFRGRETLLLFWNPTCGFCRSMHEHVLDWEESATESSPRLLVVSSGGPAETREEGFRSTVVMDTNFALGEAFGAGGTPMGALLDADGRLAAPLAAGEEAVFALTGERVSGAA